MLLVVVIVLSLVVAVIAAANFSPIAVPAHVQRGQASRLRAPHAPREARRSARLRPHVGWQPPAQPKQAFAPRDESPSATEQTVSQARMRDRYIAARFPDIARSSAGLRDFERVIKAARLFFEEDQTVRALELLMLAIEEAPTCEPTRLAELEIAFLLRNASLYSTAAREFKQRLPASKAWNEIARLGRVLAPDDENFDAPPKARASRARGIRAAQ